MTRPAKNRPGKILGRFHVLLARPDFRRNPIKALWRRLWWRLRWHMTDSPWKVPFNRNFNLLIPKSGVGALVYYQGFSEPETAEVVLRILQPGMTLFDIGAHIGEYTLLGSQAVGPKGKVHAFEPHPVMFRILETNVGMNTAGNVVLNQYAVGNSDGELDFEVQTDPSVSSLRPKSAAEDKNRVEMLRVPSIRLDSYWPNPKEKIDLIKIDVEGAELLVFQGAEHLLALSEYMAPVFIFEYAPASYARFDYEFGTILRFLEKYGYSIWHLESPRRFGRVSLEFETRGIVNLIATKNEGSLNSLSVFIRTQ